MEVALDAMYGWLGRHTNLGKDDVFIDTGSGLSYRTQITTHELASIVRSAGGFVATGAMPEAAHAWLDSLSIAGTDGTLRRRFHFSDVRGKIRGKTGTLSTAIALSGVLDIDPQRPVVFSLVTNTRTPLAKGSVRKAHEQVVAALCAYLAKTAKVPTAEPHALEPATPTAADEVEETEPEPGLDPEAATSGAP
jgi:D-alanyl-D-alanine carboxypeptidase